MHKRVAKHNEVSSDVTASNQCDVMKEKFDFVKQCRKITRKLTDVSQSGKMCF